MENFRKRLFEVLLVIIAAAFVFCIRYLSEAKCAEVGAFGNSDKANLTISDVMGKVKGERQ